MLKISKGRQLVLIFCINSLHDQKQHVLFHKARKSSIVNKYRPVLRLFKQSGAKHKQHVKWQGPQPTWYKNVGCRVEAIKDTTGFCRKELFFPE